MPQTHRPEFAASVTAEPLVGYRRAPRTFRRDRICSVPGCTTLLSIYNADDSCAVHGPHRPCVVPANAEGDVLPDAQVAV